MIRRLTIAVLLIAIAGLSTAAVAGQDASPADQSALTDGLSSWVGWPAWALSLALGIFWVYRRAHTSLLSAALAKLVTEGEEKPLYRSPVVEEPSNAGSLTSGALLLVLTTMFFLSQFVIYDYPSDLEIPSEAVDILPWLDFAPWLPALLAPLFIGLLSESRGVWVIPVLGFALGMFLSNVVAGGDPGGLIDDLGLPASLLVRAGIPALLMYLAYRFGRGIRGQFT